MRPRLYPRQGSRQHPLRMIKRLTITAVFAIPLLASYQASAIDCRHASRSYEHLICESKSLVADDRNLNGIYKAACKHAANPEKVKKDQQLWVSTTQSLCTTESCLKSAYAGRIEQLMSLYSPWCKANSHKFNNNWNSGETSFFEDLSITDDGAFTSWMHARPGISGTWTSNGCLFTLTSTSKALVFRWVLLDINNREMRILDLDESDISIFTRIKN